MLMISKYLVTLAYLHSTIEQMESTRQRASRQFVSLSPLFPFPFPILSLSSSRIFPVSNSSNAKINSIVQPAACRPIRTCCQHAPCSSSAILTWTSPVCDTVPVPALWFSFPLLRLLAHSLSCPQVNHNFARRHGPAHQHPNAMSCKQSLSL